MKTWLSAILALAMLAGCQKSVGTDVDAKNIETQIEQLKTEVEKAKEALASLKSAIAENEKQLATTGKMQQDMQATLTSLVQIKQEAEKSITKLKDLSSKTEEIFNAIRVSTASTQSQLLDINGRLFDLQVSALQEQPATLSTSTKEYTLARTDMGSFPISVEKAEPYLDGHKLTLQIGNPLAVSLTGGKLTIKYGPRGPTLGRNANGQFDFSEPSQTKYKEEKEAWEKTIKTTDISITSDLPAGAWTSVEAILTPSKPSEVAYLQIKLATTGLKMGTLRR